MEFQGTVFKIMPEIKGTSARGEWQRQEVIFEMMDGQYARKVSVTFFNKPTEVAGLKMGEAYNVSFNLESREYNDRWYTDVRAWRVMPVEAQAPQPQAQPQSQPQAAPAYAAPQPTYSAPTQSAADDVDDLPF
ncbi:MAG: DUF3127 domain-containing protein [Rikenellaceae bacterium]